MRALDYRCAREDCTPFSGHAAVLHAVRRGQRQARHLRGLLQVVGQSLAAAQQPGLAARLPRRPARCEAEGARRFGGTDRRSLIKNTFESQRQRGNAAFGEKQNTKLYSEHFGKITNHMARTRQHRVKICKPFAKHLQKIAKKSQKSRKIAKNMRKNSKNDETSRKKSET